MSAAEPNRLLSSWKEIAGFLGKSVRTVQRWERVLGLPVHRPKSRLSGIVLADAAELEKWLHEQPEGAPALEAAPPAKCARCAELEEQLAALRAQFAVVERPHLAMPSRRPQRPAA